MHHATSHGPGFALLAGPPARTTSPPRRSGWGRAYYSSPGFATSLGRRKGRFAASNPFPCAPLPLATGLVSLVRGCLLAARARTATVHPVRTKGPSLRRAYAFETPAGSPFSRGRPVRTVAATCDAPHRPAGLGLGLAVQLLLESGGTISHWVSWAIEHVYWCYYSGPWFETWFPARRRGSHRSSPSLAIARSPGRAQPRGSGRALPRAAATTTDFGVAHSGRFSALLGHFRISIGPGARTPQLRQE